jgi:hypothetical protein
MTYTVTKTTSFTITHARYLTSKVAADMHLCAQYYGEPTEIRIRRYAEELAQYINEGYLQEYEFGYKKDGERVVSWSYQVNANGLLTTDDRPGKVAAYVDVTSAAFFTFLTQNSLFFQLTSAQRLRFTAALPVHRGNGPAPVDGAGSWVPDLNYYSNGKGLGRKTFQPNI